MKPALYFKARSEGYAAAMKTRRRAHSAEIDAATRAAGIAIDTENGDEFWAEWRTGEESAIAMGAAGMPPAGIPGSILDERERLVYHLCALIAERDWTGVPDTHAVAKARAFLAEMGIVEGAVFETWQRGETGRTT